MMNGISFEIWNDDDKKKTCKNDDNIRWSHSSFCLFILRREEISVGSFIEIFLCV